MYVRLMKSTGVTDLEPDPGQLDVDILRVLPRLTVGVGGNLEHRIENELD